MPGSVSFVTKFILLWLADWLDLQLPLFFLFLGMCMVTVLGNLGLIILIALNSHLYTPMYFFFNLSFKDLCYSSVFIPKILIYFSLKKNIISHMRFMTQLHFFFCHFWILCADINGLWLLCGHLRIMLSCPLKCVPALCLVPTWWHYLVSWLTLDACWDWPSVMQTPSTIISVTLTLCFNSPAQVPMSMSWYFSLWWHQ